MHTRQEILEANLDDAANMIRGNMLESDVWLIRGLLAIYRMQTPDEQTSESTRYNNNIGFSGVDGQILASFAKQVLIWSDKSPADRKHPSPLSPKQMDITRRKLAKYAKQLARIARQNAEPVAVLV